MGSRGNSGIKNSEPNYTVSSASDMKKALVDYGFTVESTNRKGRYKVTNTKLGNYDTVRFGRDSFGNPEVKRLSGTDSNGQDTWMGYNINSFIRRLI